MVLASIAREVLCISYFSHFVVNEIQSKGRLDSKFYVPEVCCFRNKSNYFDKI